MGGLTPSPDGESRVTTVVITRDRRDDLARSLPRHAGPVVLVDNGSTDGSVDLVAEHHPEVRVVALDRNVGAAARNVGVRETTTPYVAFADDDSWWAPGALGLAADHLDAHRRLALVAGRVLVGDEHRLDPTSADMATSPLHRPAGLPGPPVLGFLACGAVVRRDAYLAAGGFEEMFGIGGEEELLALDLAAAGWDLAYVPEVVAHHHPSTTRPHSRRRRAHSARNRLLTAVLRRPLTVVARTTASVLCDGRAGLSGAAQVVPLLPRALGRRTVIPPGLERQRRRLG